MRSSRIEYKNLSVTINYSEYKPDKGPSEYHAILELQANSGMESWMQFAHIENALKLFLNEPFMKMTSLAWKRYFLTDATNQKEWIKEGKEAISVIQQPPLSGNKVALWVYAIENVDVSKTEEGYTVVSRPDYSHVFHTQLHQLNGDSYQQTQAVFSSYIKDLEEMGCSLEQHCIRTWLFVQNVDLQYQRMVIARTETFDLEGLNPKTHYITSTGIEGKYIYPRAITVMDAYAIREIEYEQIVFLKGLSHLSPTHNYGVTFERGTAIFYGDRKHVFIAGTASINEEGEIVHPLDIRKQTQRTIENISVLLNEADCSFDDVAHLLVYIRDISDYKEVEESLNSLYPDIPKIILLAPVCRPGWLVEIECMAIKETRSPRFKNF